MQYRRIVPILPPFLCLLLLLSAVFAPLTDAALIEETWNIAYKFVRPDGVEKLVPVVNNQYPGPTLRGAPNDTVRITVINNLPTESTSIHWHGIKQVRTPWSDGVPGVSQCAIGPDQSFVYEFTLDAPGTLWWHSHSGFQKSSLYGFIIVDGDQDIVGNYPEFTILLNDWYHTSSDEQIAGLFQQPFRWVGDAQSLLFNGRGQFDCSQTSKSCDPNSPDAGPAEFFVQPDTTYRLRLVGSSSLAFLNFGIDAHKVELVEAETTLLRPFTTDFLDLGPGQSVSVLLRTKTVKELNAIKNNNGLFWMQINVHHRVSGPRGLAILHYFTAGSKAKTPKRAVPEPPARDDVQWSLEHARSYKALFPARIPAAARTLTFLGTQNVLPSGRLVWAMNNVSFAFQPTPILHSLALDVEEERAKWVEVPQIPTVFDYNLTLGEAGLSDVAKLGTHVVKLEKDEVVDFVFQNTRALNGADEVHPWYVKAPTPQAAPSSTIVASLRAAVLLTKRVFVRLRRNVVRSVRVDTGRHLHMHNFWVLAYGEEHEPWTPEDAATYDTRTAVSRNTFSLLPGSWTAIRVKADNPGAVHFRMLPHFCPSHVL